MKLSTAAYTIELVDEGVEYAQTPSEGASYDKRLILSEAGTSAHGIRVSSGGQLVASAVVQSGGGPSTIHAHSAILRPDALFLAVGPHVARWAVPSLDLIWSVEIDEATCFGVHAIPDSLDLISHGELSITRITDGGVTLWSRGGADIFTGDLVVGTEAVKVADFEGRVYAFDLHTGEVMASV